VNHWDEIKASALDVANDCPQPTPCPGASCGGCDQCACPGCGEAPTHGTSCVTGW